MMWKKLNAKYFKTQRTQVWIEPESQKRFIIDIIKHYLLVVALVFFFVYSFPFVKWFTVSSGFEHQAVFKDVIRINASKWPLLLVVLFVFIFYAIMISHKVFGPIFKLKQHLKTLQGGQVRKKLFFRTGDYLMDIVDPINDFQGVVENSFVHIQDELSKVPVTEENKAAIESIKAEVLKYTQQ